MKTLFLINSSRRDTGLDDALLDELRLLMDEAGLDYKMAVTESVEESDRLIHEGLEDGIEALWVGGGDGTINYALNRVYGHDVAFGIVPMGTVNALAQAVGVPVTPAEAVRYLLQAQPVHMDVGLIRDGGGDRYFLTYATVGIHAAMFHNVDTSLKKRWGKLAFWESAARTVWRKGRLPRLLLDMEPAEEPGAVMKDYAYSFTLSNVANYSGFGSFTDEPPASPGYFELHSFRRNRIKPMALWLATLRLFGKDRARPEDGVEIRKVRRVVVRSHRGISVQVDGEPVTPKPRQVEFDCIAGGVQLLLRPSDALNLTVP